MGTGQGPPDTHRTQHARPAAPGMRPKRLACHCAAPPVPQTVLPLPRGSPAAAACTDPKFTPVPGGSPTPPRNQSCIRQICRVSRPPSAQKQPAARCPSPSGVDQGSPPPAKHEPRAEAPCHDVTNNCGRRKGARARGCGAEGASGPALTAGNNRCLQRRPLRWPRMAVSTQMSATSSSAPLGCRTLWC